MHKILTEVLSTMYYRPTGKAVAADVIPFYEDGKFRLFYLKDYRDIPNEGEGCPWCLLDTEDLVGYLDHGPVLLRGSVDQQDLYVFTGCCIKDKGEYYIFYTGHNPHLREQGLPEQKVMLAKSNNLIDWEKQEDFLFQADGSWLEQHDFRDPFVFYDTDNSRYCMLLAGREKNSNPLSTRGVTLVCYSDDLLNWTISKDYFYAPNAYFTHECPDLFKMGDWWYLVFSEFTDKIVTKYRMSKNMFGPWITPKSDSFDGHAFYAAKSASDGNRRILFGWNCIKDKERDDNYWQWGGTIITHEIVQAVSGELYVKCPKEVSLQYCDRVELVNSMTMGDVKQLSSDSLSIGNNGGRSIALFNEMPTNCKLELTFNVADDIGDFGVVLRCCDNMAYHYYVKFEPKFNRLAFDKIPRKDNTAHTNVDVERYCPIVLGQDNKILIIVEDSVLEVYVNDKVAMSCRMFDVISGAFGVQAHNTTVLFKDIKLHK